MPGLKNDIFKYSKIDLFIIESEEFGHDSCLLPNLAFFIFFELGDPDQVSQAYNGDSERGDPGAGGREGGSELSPRAAPLSTSQFKVHSHNKKKQWFSTILLR